MRVTLILPAIIAAVTLAACSTPNPAEENLKALVAKAKYPADIAAFIEGMEFRDETFLIPEGIQEPGTVTVLWRETGWAISDGAAVVYKVNDGRLVPLRYCPLEADDVYNSAKNTDHHKVTNVIDENTTSWRCETKEEAAARGRPNPMVVVKGRSGGFLGMGEGDPTFAEYGIL